MEFKNFSIDAIPYIHRAYCECGKEMIDVSNGFLTKAMYCPKCESVYELRLIKTPKKKIGKEFLEQARKEYASKHR